MMLRLSPQFWIARHHRAFRDHDGRILYSFGDPESLSFFAEGRRATRAEITESIESGIPILRQMAMREGSGEAADLDKQYAKALRLVPQDLEGASKTEASHGE